MSNMKTKKINRRDFLKSTSVAGAGLMLGVSGMTASSYARIQGANERVNFAVLGLHGRGNAHLGAIDTCDNGMVTTICDVDSRETNRIVAGYKEKNMTAPKVEKNFRKVLESKDVDAITIATPEHLQTTIAITALQMGKHVYLEKPGSHNPEEGELVIRTQEKTGKLVQFGDQQRSSAHTMEAMQKIHSGEIGDVYFAKAWYSNTRKSIGTGKEVPVPDYLDWELWQGPAPRSPYKDNVHPYNWHWFWNWGCGECLNNGIHEVDLCVWALQVRFPKKVTATGGRFHYKDDWEFYDTMVTTFEYGDKMITWEGKSCQGMKYFDRGRGATIHGTNGTVLVDRQGYRMYDPDNNMTYEYVKAERDATLGVQGEGPLTNVHFQNFINAITRGEKLHSPIQEGNVAATMLHLSNIAWKFDRQLWLDQKTAHILNDKEAMTMWKREYQPGWEPKV